MKALHIDLLFDDGRVDTVSIPVDDDIEVTGVRVEPAPNRGTRWWVNTKGRNPVLPERIDSRPDGICISAYWYIVFNGVIGRAMPVEFPWSTPQISRQPIRPVPYRIEQQEKSGAV